MSKVVLFENLQKWKKRTLVGSELPEIVALYSHPYPCFVPESQPLLPGQRRQSHYAYERFQLT